MSFHTAARTSPPNSFLLSAMKSCLMMRPKWRRQMSSFPLTWPDFLKRPPAVLRIPQVPGAKQNSAVIRRGVRGRCPYTEWMFTSLSRTCCHCVLHLCLKVSVGTKKNQKKSNDSEATVQKEVSRWMRVKPSQVPACHAPSNISINE